MVSIRISGNVMVNSSVSKPKSRSWNQHARFLLRQRYALFPAKLYLKSHSDARGAEGRDPRLMSVLDPAVGSGRMLLHASNFSYNLYGCDIDPLVAAICRINAAFYVPWLAFPFSQGILGVPVPPPPPEPLPLPEEYKPASEETLFRCDDRGQGLLFG